MVKKLLPFSLIAIVAWLLAVAMPIYAVSVDDALYRADIVAVNTGTTESNVATIVSLNTQTLIDGHYTTSDLLNTAIQTAEGADVAYMPGVGTNPWVFHISSIGQSESKPYVFYCGGPAMQTGLMYFPNGGGMTTNDNDASLELGNNFVIEQKGWVDTSYAGNKYLIYKDSAFKTYISSAGNITSAITPSISPLYSSTSDGSIYATGASSYSAAQTAVSGTVNAGATTFTIGQRGTVYDQDQTTGTTEKLLYSGNFTLVGERIDSFVGIITSAQFYLKKVGLPTGTASCTVRSVTGDTLLGTIGTLNVSTLTTSFAYITFNSAPVAVTTPTNIRICIGYSGGNSSNYISLSDTTPSATSWGIESYYLSSWSDQSAYDVTFQNITYNTYQVDRGYVYFDTSSIPDSVEIASATLYLYGQADNSTTDFNISINSGMPTYPTDPLAATDFNKTYYTDGGGSLTTSGFSIAGYNAITLNSTGLGWINKTGTTKFCIRSSRDVAATTPTGDEYVTVYATEQTGTANDPYLVVNYSPLVTATGISSGVHTVKTIATGGGTNMLQIWVGDGDAAPTLRHEVALNGASVPNNSNNWSFLTNGSMLYMDYHKIWIDGTAPANLKQHIVYERDTVFDDLTTNNNDSTPTFRTTSSDPDVSATFQNFEPIEEAVYLISPTEETPEMLTTVPEEPAELYGAEGGGTGHLPGAEIINTMLDHAGIPQDFFWINAVYGLAALAVLLSYQFIRSSLLFPAIAGFVVILFFALATGGNPIPLWTIFPYILNSAGFLVSERVFGW
jgi:hypothetical protein